MLNDCMYGIIFRDINPRRTSAAVATPPATAKIRPPFSTPMCTRPPAHRPLLDAVLGDSE
ncbi:lysine 5,6-aminomutase subunit alpha TIM-barrel domain-containing protein [Actinomadura geliboluensis]|uniref:lysine 5,6-aminomutase subunit alpha TIM-barrel domain-containing protein n=1 Tax=Actinomadura geliboluensis TaxID=882440 RepID=UPI003716EA38